jgi:hypothetical protein
MFQRGTSRTVSFCINMAQISVSTGMCMFGSQILLLKVCELLVSIMSIEKSFHDTNLSMPEMKRASQN